VLSLSPQKAAEETMLGCAEAQAAFDQTRSLGRDATG